MYIVRKISVLLILAGLVLFTVSFSLSKYMLTDQVLTITISDYSHIDKLYPELQKMMGKRYSCQFPFIKDFNNAVEKTNQAFKDQGQWDQVIWTDYSLPVAKNAMQGIVKENTGIFFLLTYILVIFGALLYIFSTYLKGPAGIKNNYIFKNSLTSRGLPGWILGICLVCFYILLYFFPAYMAPWILMVDEVSIFLSGNPASQWFLYGFLYTTLVFVLGLRMLVKYRNNAYQVVRTISVMFFQTAIAFIIPEILVSLNKPYFDFKNIWPLDYDFFYSWHLGSLTNSGNLGIFMLVWGIVLIVIAVPVFTYFFGKRWYCSWVCGCGGLAETAGDPFRQLSDKRLSAWKIERYLIYSVLVFAVLVTAVTLINYFSEFSLLGQQTESLHKWYGFFIGSIFSGVIGTGFYPFMGNRVWCRFGCPLAAYLGIVQKYKSRFRITTNVGQCISCGNCSAYCEMGIDVRWYAQRGQNIIRASCVGCGICSAVCPRGVLRLENKSEKGRYEVVGLPGNDGVLINE